MTRGGAVGLWRERSWEGGSEREGRGGRREGVEGDGEGRRRVK